MLRVSTSLSMSESRFRFISHAVLISEETMLSFILPTIFPLSPLIRRSAAAAPNLEASTVSKHDGAPPR